MANYSELLNDINAAIYENNDQEIDALEVRAILREMVTSLGSGFLFKGIATPSSPGTSQAPDQNVFYLATTAGTYTYLGGLVVAAGEVAFLCFDGTWTKKSSALLSTGSIVDDLVTSDATKPLSAKQGKVLADAGAATAAEVTALGQKVGDLEGIAFTSSDFENKAPAGAANTARVRQKPGTDLTGVSQIFYHIPYGVVESSAATWVNVQFYDSSKTYISGINSIDFNGKDVDILMESSDFPTGAAYIALYFGNTGSSTIPVNTLDYSQIICLTDKYKIHEILTDLVRDNESLQADMKQAKGDIFGLQADVAPLVGIEEIDLSQLTAQDCSLGTSNWYKSGSPSPSHIAIQVTPGEKLAIELVTYNGQTSGSYTGWYTFVTSSYNPPYTNGQAIPNAGDNKRYSVPIGEKIEVFAPPTAAYLILTTIDGANKVCGWTAERLSAGVAEVVGNDAADVIGDFRSDWELGGALSSRRAFVYNTKLARNGGVVTFKLSSYTTYKIGVTITKDIAWAATQIYDTGWKQEDISVHLSEAETGYYIRVSIGRVDNTAITLTEFLSLITEMSYTYNTAANGLVARVEKLEEEVDGLANLPSRIPMAVLGTSEYVGRKVDVAAHSYTWAALGSLTSTGQSVQGFAIYGDYLFQCHNTNSAVVVFKLSTGTSIQTISLTAQASNHANSAGFGGQKYDASDPFPCLYISSEGEKKVYVYRVTGTEGAFSLTLVQTIIFATSLYYPNMYIDAPNQRGIVVGYEVNSWNNPAGNQMHCICFDLPDVTAGDTTLSASYNEFTFPFIYAAQGAFARYGKLYIAFGNTNAGLNIGGILVIDYILRNVETFVDLKGVGNFEPEGAGIWDDGIVFTTQGGYVYKLTF